MTKLHIVYEFAQLSWPANYRKCFAEQSAKVQNKYGKQFYKLLNNSFYGRTQEKIRKRTNNELIEETHEQKTINRQ